MRLWHKDLLPVLPRQQLVSQWRECCAIMKAIAENNTPNHILVNKIMNYPLCHFAAYTHLIIAEMKKRKYQTRADAIGRFCNNYESITDRNPQSDADYFLDEYGIDNIFLSDQNDCDWHNDRYYMQCLYNLQEKYDCGGLTEDEWSKIAKSAAELKGISIL